MSRFDFKKESAGFLALLKGQNLAPFTGAVSFEDPEEAPKPFAPHYEEFIRPHVQRFEEKRIETLQKVRKRLVMAIPVSIGVLVLVVLMFMFAPIAVDTKGDLTGLAFMAVLGAVAWVYYPIVKYAAEIKEKIFPNIFSFFGDDYVFQPEGGLSIEELALSGIIPSHNRKKTEDYVKGAYKDVALELIEAHLQQQTGTGKRRRTVTKFKGMFILLSMNKNFSGKTVVKKDAGGIGNWFSKTFANLENVKLEDPVFEKQFECYSSDQVEARYLLTTSFMERLLELSRLFGNSGIQCSFYDNKLLLMIPSKENRFEVSSVFQPATFVDDINTILKEMQVIFQIIDILKLDQRTGL